MARRGQTTGWEDWVFAYRRGQTWFLGVSRQLGYVGRRRMMVVVKVKSFRQLRSLVVLQRVRKITANRVVTQVMRSQTALGTKTAPVPFLPSAQLVDHHTIQESNSMPFPHIRQPALDGLESTHKDH